MLLSMLSIMLLSVSAFVWVAFNSSVLGYQSAAVSQPITQQFLVAEYVLTQGEQWLQQTPIVQLPLPVISCVQSPCILQAQAAAYLPQQPQNWWQDENNLALKRASMNIPAAHRAFYAIEQFMEPSNQEERYYRVTAWTLLDSQVTPSILQSTWVKSANVNQRLSWRQW